MGETGVDRVLERAVAARGRASSPSERRIRLLTRAAGLAGLVVAVIGAFVVIAWLFGLPGLTHVGPGVVTMKFTTAVCLVALGAAIATAALAQVRERPRLLHVAVALVVPVFAIALLVLVEQLFGLRLAVDNPFGLDPGDAGTPVPGRMAQMTAVSFAVLSAALVLSVRGRARTAQGIALIALAIAMISVVGYAYGVEGLYGAGPFNIMALHTALMVGLAAFGMVFLRPADGYIAVCVGNTAGGVILRRVLPWTVVAPFLIGVVILSGLRADWYDAPTAIALFVIVGASAGAAMVWFQGDRLRDVDLRRGGAEDALRIAQEALAERDRVEAQLAANVRRTQRILATAADAYIAIDAQGCVTDWNDAAVVVFGWSRAEAIGVPLDGLLIPPDLKAEHRAGMARFAATGEAPILGRRLELEAMTRSGSRIPVELTVWAEGREPVVGFHAFVRDITERKNAELNLRRLNADLAEFAAVAAHDLRSPLTTIQMQVDLVLTELEEGWGPDETREWIERIGRTAERGTTLIDDLLAYVSIGRGQHSVGPVDLDALVHEVVENEVSAAQRPVTSTVDRLPVIAGDAALLRQLVGNLVGNAIKYVPADRTPEVVVDALIPAGAKHCVLCVSDNGDGFDDDEQDRVFDMFQRGRGSTQAPGTGIGLAICRRVAERHGGRIWIDPDTTSGSRVCVQLPLWTSGTSSEP